MFGRATIRLGIGPHSSWVMFLHGRSEDRDGTKRAVDGDNASWADLVRDTRDTRRPRSIYRRTRVATLVHR